MVESAPDIYEIEFKDIYEIDFVDLEPSQEDATPEASEASTIVVASVSTAERLGDAALAEVVELPTPTTSVEPPATKIHSAPEVIQPTEVIVVSDELQLKVNDIVSAILEANAKAIVPYAQVRDMLVGTKRLSRDDIKILREAIRRDGRMEYFKNGCYLVIDRSDKVMQAYQNGEDPLVDKQRISELIDKLLPVLRLGGGGHLRNKGLLGAIKGLGDFLSEDEKNEFFVQFYNHPLIKPMNNGDFFVSLRPEAKHDEPKPQPEEAILSEEGAKPLGVVARGGKALTTRQVNKALNEINRSEGVRRAADLGKRKANQRTHGRNFRKGSGKKSQGKAHGKKVSLDQLIDQMNGKA